jgi:hypothetical protein
MTADSVVKSITCYYGMEWNALFDCRYRCSFEFLILECLYHSDVSTNCFLIFVIDAGLVTISSALSFTYFAFRSNATFSAVC